MSKLLEDAGKACAAYHDEHVRGEFENRAHTVAPFTVRYDLVRVHKPLRVLPAMAAGVSDRPWSMDDVAALEEAAAPVPGERGPYKKHA